MSDPPVPRDPGQDDDPPGVPAGLGDRPWLGSPNWQLVPQSPDWPEWMDQDAHAHDEYPGDPDEYQDPDNAPPPGLDDNQLAALMAEAHEITAKQARAAEGWARLGHTAGGGGGRGRLGRAPRTREMIRLTLPVVISTCLGDAPSAAIDSPQAAT